MQTGIATSDGTALAAGETTGEDGYRDSIYIAFPFAFA
ncbi:MAG: hypothetical protein K0R99_4583, partial [Microbacterium sp.]|nr:hypothetical protein [Microbacterium sp.]